MSLYLKYRPTTVDELDLTRVRNAFGKIIKSGTVAHAYLFDGPRGSGKTSSARILARIVNCKENKDVGEPCGKCDACRSLMDGSATDLIEIDAASNRGIDDIRELKQRIKLAPSILRKKVYIIDEVHMLTTEAFNALLKTLEEPPDHALFILCTTESHKIPETIISRCTRVQYSKASKEEMKRSLERVIKGEKVSVDDDALNLIVSQVDGSFRDGVKILEQVLQGSDKKVDRAMVEEVVFGVSGHDPKAFVLALVSKDVVESLRIVKNLSDSGMDMKHLLKSAIEMIRKSVLSKYGVGEESEIAVGPNGIELIRIMDGAISNISISSVPEIMVEMMVLEWCGEEGVIEQSSGGKNGKKVVNSNKGVVKTNKIGSEDKHSKLVDANKNEIYSEKEGHEFAEEDEIPEDKIKDGWRKVMKSAMGNYSLEALLNTARMRGVEDGEMVIEVDYEFHKQQLETERFRRKVEELADSAFGRRVRLRFEVSKVSNKTIADLSEDKSRDNISEIEDDDLASMAEDIFKS